MKERIRELDALRGIAALYVLAFHYTDKNPVFHNIFQCGVTGVDLFFMISGFVIFLTLNRTQNIKTFIISRFTRLFPTYWVCVSISFVVLMFATNSFAPFNKGDWVNYLGNMSMLQYYWHISNLDSSYWTMIIELLFYTFMALLFIFKQMSRINIIGYLFLLFCLFYSEILANYFASAHSFIGNWFPLVNHFPLFFAGILFYKMKFDKENKYLIYGIIACAFVQLTLFEQGGKSVIFISFNQYLILIIIYFILFWLFVKEHLKFINIKPLLYLGTISYSLYLLHQAISKKFLIPLFSEKMGMNIIVSFILSFVVIVLLASLITFYIELPSITTLKRKLFVLAGIKKSVSL